MKVNKIKVRNYHGIKAGEVEFTNPVTVFTGANGSGKSSWLSAVRYGITGDDKTPLNVEASNGMVTVDIDLGTPSAPDVKQISRCYGTKNEVYIGAKKTSAKSIAQLMGTACHASCTPEVMKNMTGGGLMDAIKKGDLAKLLLGSGMIPSLTDTDTVIRISGLSAEADKLLVATLPKMPEQYGIDKIEQAYKELYAERTVKNRQLKELAAKAVFAGTIPARTVEAIDKEMAGLMTGKETQRLYEQQVAMYERQLQKRADMMTQLKTLEETMATVKTVMPDQAQKQHLEDIRKRMSSKLASNSKTIGVLSGNIALLGKGLTNLESSKCPLSDKLVCTTDKTSVKEELKEQLAQNEAESKRLLDENATIQERITQCDTELAKYAEAVEAYNQAKALFEKHRLMKENMPELPEKPVAPKAAMSPIEIETKMVALKEERAYAIAYAQAMTSKTEADKMSKEIDTMTELIKGLSPKGVVYTKILNVMLKDIQDYMNLRAKTIKADLEVGMLVNEDGVQFACRQTAGGPFVPAMLLSSGEQAVLLFLVIDMMNSLAQLDVLLLDDLDKLDKEAFKSLLELVTSKEVTDQYDNILLATVDHDDLKKIIEDKAGEGELSVVEL